MNVENTVSAENAPITVSMVDKIRTAFKSGESFSSGTAAIKIIAERLHCNRELVKIIRDKEFPHIKRMYKRKKVKKAQKEIKLYLPGNVDTKRIDSAIEKVRVAAAGASKKFFEDTAVNHPAHYTAGNIETYDFIVAKKLSYELGNVVKYVSRAEYKGNKLQDLQKARWYLDAAIKQEEQG
jgi:hypothetical protein